MADCLCGGSGSPTINVTNLVLYEIIATTVATEGGGGLLSPYKNGTGGVSFINVMNLMIEPPPQSYTPSATTAQVHY